MFEDDGLQARRLRAAPPSPRGLAPLDRFAASHGFGRSWPPIELCRASPASVVSMDASIREYRPADQTDVLDLSLRAWGPIFASMEYVLGRVIYTRLHGHDWRAYQSNSVKDVLADPAIHVWVGENISGDVVGFAAAKIVDTDRRLGEIVMVAVDPSASGRGLGTALTQHATEWLRAQGMQTAMIETGGDAGHAAGRRTYEKAAYTLMPIARYFKAL